MSEKLTWEQHKQRHIDLHSSLDELWADYMRHNRDQRNFTQMPVIDLVSWSHKQTISPDELPND